MYKGLSQVEENLNLGFVIVNVHSSANNMSGESCYKCIGVRYYNCNTARAARTDGEAR